MHVTNISRYERGENKPTTDVLKKLADALGVSTDFLMYGSTNDLADDTISDKELLTLFKKVNSLSSEKKKMVKEFLSAFVLQTELKDTLT